jgi:hypothetical protein
VGGQIGRDHLYVCVFKQAPDPSPVARISPEAVNEYGSTKEWPRGWRHVATVPPRSRPVDANWGLKPELSADGAVRGAYYLHPVEGTLILALALPLRWALKSLALLISMHPTGVNPSAPRTGQHSMSGFTNRDCSQEGRLAGRVSYEGLHPCRSSLLRAIRPEEVR